MNRTFQRTNQCRLILSSPDKNKNERYGDFYVSVNNNTLSQVT